ncbi:MAG TPA: hypothetical protein VGB62_01965 [Allosphingosinicella sp.]
MARLQITRGFAIAGLAMMASACSTVVPDRRTPMERMPEFVGRVLTVETAKGQVSTMRFWRDGTVRASFSGKETAGRWDMDGRDLCFTWAGSYRECWPHAQPFRPGRTHSVTSNRGNVVKVTMR